MASTRINLERALFLLIDGDAGERFHRVLGDLVDAGLQAGTLLYVLEENREREDPFLEEMSTWVRRFEALGLRDVSVALKRGDPVAWVRELSAIHPGEWVVAATPRSAPQGFLRPASPWRNLPVPVFLIPSAVPAFPRPLFDEVLVALKAPEAAAGDVKRLVHDLPTVTRWRGLHVRTHPADPPTQRGYPIPLTVTAGECHDISNELLAAAREGASLLVVLAQAEGADPTLPAGHVIESLVRATEIPVLLWPAKADAGPHVTA